MQNHKKWRSGFTLVEILVVLAVIAIISSISFSAFKSVTEGNKRTNCQSNLSQIYKSVRLYSQDYDGRFPYLNAGGAPNQTATPPNGIGLWSLYTFPKPGATNNCTPDVAGFNTDYNTDLDLPPANEDSPQQLAGYVRSAKIFHCPADKFAKDIQLRTPSAACITQNVPTGTLTVKQGNAVYLNPSFLSYQQVDDRGTTPTDTYSSFRKAGPEIRQLTPYSSNNTILDRPTRDMTVLTWCRFHRSLDADGKTVDGKRNFDNVLFSDGSVQSLPTIQTVSSAATPSATSTCSGWQRVPREKAESMASTSDCTPSP
ncbi:prepilin-type N-terminal cleavage/methylation domain-containing protein [Abditibacterium utsteinense]|uniref:Prepilin-type N-terminal cleavage/methylation domain-containing protein n=1 Tax=Abditibacterium utsteinense TaxID=1960156 RepID=A0A2S8SVV9_9BACT|nr:prepilin-type N-terminal cleavage/methylation domain-containing protein [Abditibacterium utsteinense]PQV64924.1 prepilin-type N-terminal cleavage/methylation domain-containing protein [Abditibacterium utsteinense]